MQYKNFLKRTFIFIVGSLIIVSCTFSSNHFVGTWIQVADISSYEIKAIDTPATLRISKNDLFYFVEVSSDRGNSYNPYPDKSGKYELSDDKKSLVSIAFGSKFSIVYRDDNILFENAWLGYFKKK